MDIHEFMTALRDHTLPHEEWTHFGHLRAILYLLTKTRSEFEAISEFRCTAIQYGTASNPGYQCAHCYHETLTVFWALQVKAFTEEHTGKGFAEIEALLQNSKLMDKGYIYEFYSMDVIISLKARAIYIEPDLKL